MKKYILKSLLCLTAFVLFSCAGASTDISGTYTKSGYSGKKFKNILVVAISDEITKRNSVESAVVKELGIDKIKSTTSSKVLDFSKIDKNNDGKVDSTKRDEVLKMLTDAGYDGALVISLLDIKEQTKYVPGTVYYQPAYYGGYGGYYRGFYGYSYNTYSVVSTPGYYVEKKNIYLETRLFDLKTDDLLWATKSETLNPENLTDFSKSYARALVNALIDDKVVK
jgi:hypothetical protein